MDWNDQLEMKQATEILLPMWVDIDVEDALELLGIFIVIFLIYSWIGPSFLNQKVRKFAGMNSFTIVKQLEKADDIGIGYL